MSDEKMVSEKDAVRRERAAFLNGMVRMHGELNPSDVLSEPWSIGRIDKIAALAYPFPTVTRPRVGFSNGTAWRVTEGRLEWQDKYDDWNSSGQFMPTPTLVNLWADLLANPTEEVDA